jgi:hypothetical protein
LDLLIADYPEPIQLAQAHAQRAECLSALGEADAGLVAYREALDTERKHPNVKTDAYIGFGELALELAHDDLYHEALSVLDEFGGDEALPIFRYRSFAVRALVVERLGDVTAARRYAEYALDAAAATESRFRYHRKLGLVADQETDTHARLLALAGSTH